MSIRQPLFDCPEGFSAIGSPDEVELFLSLERQGDTPDCAVEDIATSFDASLDALGLSVRLSTASALALYHALGCVLDQD